jgi:hypothetical protein
MSLQLPLRDTPRRGLSQTTKRPPSADTKIRLHVGCSRLRSRLLYPLEIITLDPA